MERLMLRRVAFAVLVSVVICAGWWFKTRPDGQLHIIAPNVAGEGLLIKTPSGAFIVIDGSRDAVGLTTFVTDYVPLWERSLAALVITRSDGSRLPGALALARHYTFDHALLAPTRHDPTALSLIQTLSSNPTRIAPLDADASLTIDGVTVRVLLPPDDHGGAVMLVEYANFRALLAPTVSDAQAIALIQNAPAATLLWWPWERSDSRKIAETLGAHAVLYSEGASATTSTEALTFDARGANQHRLLHKALHGTIRINTDGSTLTIITEH